MAGPPWLPRTLWQQEAEFADTAGYSSRLHREAVWIYLRLLAHTLNPSIPNLKMKLKVLVFECALENVLLLYFLVL